MGISKTDYMRGMQCPRMLWLDAHHPELKIIPPEVLERLDKGNEFGDKAMGMFGPFTEVTTYLESGRLDYNAMIQKTKQCIENGTQVICEAAFSWYGNYCAVDILRKAEDGYELYEVKNSSHLGEQFIKDVGFQWFILNNCGVRPVRRFVVLPGPSENEPYLICDISEESKKYFTETANNFWRLFKIKKQVEEVTCDTGEQCCKPYRCWYYEHCHKTE